MRSHITTVGWSRRLPLLLWLLAGLLIALQIAPRLGDGSWQNRLGIGSTVSFNGVPIHWEWLDVAQSALLAEGVSRWRAPEELDRWGQRGVNLLSTQNASRFLPGPVVSWLALWTRDLWRAAVVATWLCWFVAVGAMYALCRALIADPERGRTIGIIAAGLVVFSPGFTAFANHIDTQSFGYAAAVVGLLALQRSPVFGSEALHAAVPSQAIRHVLALTLVLFIADATKNLGTPLLALLWLFYVGLDGGASGLPLLSRVRRAALVTAGFIGLQACWWLVVHAVVLGQTYSQNDPWRHIAYAVSQAGGWQGLVGWVAAHNHAQIANLMDSHTGLIVLLFLPGLVFLPRRAALWVLIWVVLIAVGMTITRNYPRTAYLAYPGMYLAAAAAAEGLGRLAVVRWELWQPRLTRWLLPMAIVGIKAWMVLGDLRGDLTQAQRWFAG